MDNYQANCIKSSLSDIASSLETMNNRQREAAKKPDPAAQTLRDAILKADKNRHDDHREAQKDMYYTFHLLSRTVDDNDQNFDRLRADVIADIRRIRIGMAAAGVSLLALNTIAIITTLT